MKFEDKKIFEAFYSFFEQNTNASLDYDYFVSVFLPMKLNIKTLKEINQLERFMNSSEIGKKIKSMCDATVANNAKQNGIQFINKFGNPTEKKIIINIKKKNDE